MGENKVTWYKTPWLFVECYLYRKINEFIRTTKHMKEYDPFVNEKNFAYENRLEFLKKIKF